MSVEFLASNEVKCRCHPPMNCTVPKWVKFNFVKVRDTLLNCGLSPAGRRPLVCIDECQVNLDSLINPPPSKIKMSLQRCDDDVQLKVLDELFGWTGFRESYGNSTWRWLVAALGPKYVKCRVRRGTIGPPGNWTAGSSCLKEDWRWYLGGGPLSGQVMVHNVIAYLSSLNVKQCQASSRT